MSLSTLEQSIYFTLHFIKILFFVFKIYTQYIYTTSVYITVVLHLPQPSLSPSSSPTFTVVLHGIVTSSPFVRVVDLCHHRSIHSFQSSPSHRCRSSSIVIGISIIAGTGGCPLSIVAIAIDFNRRSSPLLSIVAVVGRSSPSLVDRRRR